jgi:hypothetical protein
MRTAVAAGSLLVVAVDVVQAQNDKQQLETLLADASYFSAANVEACEKAGIEPLIAMGRQPHHPPPRRCRQLQRIRPLRKQTPEPVFGIINAAIWTPPNVRWKLEEAKSSSAFYYKTSVRRAASRGDGGEKRLAGLGSSSVLRRAHE